MLSKIIQSKPFKAAKNLARNPIVQQMAIALVTKAVTRKRK